MTYEAHGPPTSRFSLALSISEVSALRNLSRKKAGLEVEWIVIADARKLTDLGLAARNRSGWHITTDGLAALSRRDRATPDPARDAPTIARLPVASLR